MHILFKLLFLFYKALSYICWETKLYGSCRKKKIKNSEILVENNKQTTQELVF